MRIFIWGTGRLVGHFLDKHLSIDDIEGFIDNNSTKVEHMGKKVFSPYEMLNQDYAVILVINIYSKQIQGQSEKIGLNMNKIIYLYNNCEKVDMNKDYDFISDVLGKKYSDILKNRNQIVRVTEANSDSEISFIDGYDSIDYVRIKIFNFVVKEINIRKIQGEVAEVGVFRGEFAQYINKAFPDKKCYLFDTFEGFNEDEANKELSNKNCTKAFVEAYKQTELNIVLKKMTYLDNVIVKQGYFPDSLNSLEEKFAFVSIDVDFEESIYNCLDYFYPRLNHGGYLFVHDYNSDLYGVRLAIEKYENDHNMFLCKVPICDANGTVVITK